MKRTSLRRERLRRSHKGKENRDQNKINSDQSVHGSRGAPRTGA